MSSAAKGYREYVLIMLRNKGLTLVDYLRRMVENGRSRDFIINYHVEQGFFDEEIEGALIELGMRAH